MCSWKWYESVTSKVNTAVPFICAYCMQKYVCQSTVNYITSSWTNYLLGSTIYGQGRGSICVCRFSYCCASATVKTLMSMRVCCCSQNNAVQKLWNSGFVCIWILCCSAKVSLKLSLLDIDTYHRSCIFHSPCCHWMTKESSQKQNWRFVV